MNKNTRKNTPILKLPRTVYYTIQDLFKLNKHPDANTTVPDITIRVRHSNVIAEGKVAEIGCIPGGHGRPQKVFARTPVTKIVLEKAKADGITLVDNAEKLVSVISVTPTATIPASTPVLDQKQTVLN